MSILNPAIDDYLERLAGDDDPVLREMERLAAERDFPIVGPQVGRLLDLLTRLLPARRVLELGSGFGYSALWFARAMGPGGRVVMTEGSAERAREAVGFLERAGLSERVRSEVGDALQIAPTLEGPFDIVFNDVDKQDYPKVLPLLPPLLRPGGLFISDNMLWHGHVADPDHRDPATEGVRELTRRLEEDPHFKTTLLPIRDGVTVALRLR